MHKKVSAVTAQGCFLILLRAASIMAENVKPKLPSRKSQNRQELQEPKTNRASSCGLVYVRYAAARAQVGRLEALQLPLNGVRVCGQQQYSPLSCASSSISPASVTPTPVTPAPVTTPAPEPPVSPRDKGHLSLPTHPARRRGVTLFSGCWGSWKFLKWLKHKSCMRCLQLLFHASLQKH